jgi:hypothetical protein
VPKDEVVEKQFYELENCYLVIDDENVYFISYVGDKLGWQVVEFEFSKAYWHNLMGEKCSFCKQAYPCNCEKIDREQRL